MAPTMMMRAMPIPRPACWIAQGIVSKDVPIIVFHTDKLRGTMYEELLKQRIMENTL